MPDDARNPELEALAEVITHGILREINLRWKAKPLPNFLLILTFGDKMEMSYATDDHDALFDAMTDVSATWIEDGLVHLEVDENPDTPHPVH